MNSLELIKRKQMSSAELVTQIKIWRFLGKKIVFTNGCFDIIHAGHVDYLAKAAACGDILIIGLNSDSSVQRIKGPERPIVPEFSRKLTLASLVFVDAVVLFDEETPYELIKLVQPDILVKGSDYKAEDVVGYDIVTARNGEVKTIDLVEGFSTTAIVNKIKMMTE